MPGIDGVGGPRPISNISQKTDVDIEALLPKTLGKAVSAAEFEAGINRFQSHYPSHGSVAQISNALKEGLEMEPDASLPLSKASRALASALSRLKNAEGS